VTATISMIYPSDNPRVGILFFDEPETGLPRFGLMLCNGSDDEDVNILPKAGRKGLQRVLKYADWAAQPELSFQ